MYFFLAIMEIVFASVLIGWPATAIWKRLRHLPPDRSPVLAKLVHILTLAIILLQAGILVVEFMVRQRYGGVVVIPPQLRLLLMDFSRLFTGMVVVSIPLAVVAWWRSFWSRGWRIHQMVVTGSGVLFVWYLKIQGFL